MESDVKDLRLHEYTIALFADIRSERHSDSNTTHTEKEWKRTKVREKEGRYNVPVCLRVITGVNNTRGAKEREKEREKEDHPRGSR